jgi:hypothetical protein
MQVVRYYQYLKGEHAGTSLGKDKLLLQATERLAERSGNSKVLTATMAEFPEEAFGSRKHRADVPLSFEGELSHDLQEDHAPNNLGTTVEVCRPLHVTAIQEIACDESLWHIVRLPKTSLKACFVQQVVTKKKCSARIVGNSKSTATPTYIGIIVHWKKDKEERMQFFFCNDDIKWYMKSTRWRWILSKPNVPNIWSVKIGIHLSKKEILDFENVGF